MARRRGAPVPSPRSPFGQRRRAGGGGGGGRRRRRRRGRLAPPPPRRLRRSLLARMCRFELRVALARVRARRFARGVAATSLRASRHPDLPALLEAAARRAGAGGTRRVGRVRLAQALRGRERPRARSAHCARVSSAADGSARRRPPPRSRSPHALAGRARRGRRRRRRARDGRGRRDPAHTRRAVLAAPTTASGARPLARCSSPSNAERDRSCSSPRQPPPWPLGRSACVLAHDRRRRRRTRPQPAAGGARAAGRRLSLARAAAAGGVGSPSRRVALAGRARRRGSRPRSSSARRCRTGPALRAARAGDHGGEPLCFNAVGAVALQSQTGQEGQAATNFLGPSVDAGQCPLCG